MADSQIEGLNERELDALTWHEFFMRPGDRQMDAEGYWSSRMGVRLVFPHYANDSVAAARIEAEISRRGLRRQYDQVLQELVESDTSSPSAVDIAGNSATENVVNSTPDQRRRAALMVVLAHQV